MRKNTFSWLILALTLASAPALFAGYLQINGNPLEIHADEQGNIGVLRWQGGILVPQYYSTYAKGSVLFLNGADPSRRWGSGTSTFALWDDETTGRFTAVTHVKPTLNSIQTEMDAGASGVRIRQLITYTNGQSFYTVTWQISNTSAGLYTNLHFLHGGDVAPAGEDFASGFWDVASNLVFVMTTNAADGLMGLQGHSSTPAERHYEAHFQLVREATKAAALSSTVESALHDAGYALQWTRQTLAPGETWTIVMRELWSLAEMLWITAPPGQTGAPGQELGYVFVVGNYRSVDDTIRLSLADNSWPAVITQTNVFLPSGQASNVLVRVTIPAGTPDGATDPVKLVAQSASTPAVTAAASVVTTARAPTPTVGSLVCVLQPPEAVAAGAQWRLTSGPNTNWQSSGTTLTNIPTNVYIVTFRDLSGWTRPTDQVAVVASGVTNSITGTYVRLLGVFTNVTDRVRQPLFTAWVLNRQTGTLFGTLHLQNANPAGGGALSAPFYLALPASTNFRLMQPSGSLANGTPYVDLTPQVLLSQPDGRLDPGESVILTNIEVYSRTRAAPPDGLFSVWGVTVP